MRSTSRFTGFVATLPVVFAIGSARAVPPGGAPPMDPSRRTVALDRAVEDIGDAARDAVEPKVAVCWIVDASRSMEDDRGRIRSQIENLFKKIEGRKELRMAVMAFDKIPQVVLPMTANRSAVQQAVAGIGAKGHGTENCMAAVMEACRLMPAGASTHRMAVVVTDERGNDDDRVEEAVAAAASARTRVFVLGREAPFGWPFAYERDQETAIVMPVRAGPESAGIETLQKHPLCCFDLQTHCRKQLIDDPRRSGPESRYQAVDPLRCELGFDDQVPSGFGSWALARLAAETGGRYFMIGARESYTRKALEGYEPELGTRAEWQRRNASDPLRQTVLRVLQELDQAKNCRLPWYLGKGEAKRAIKRSEEIEASVDAWTRAVAAVAPRTLSGAGAPNRRWVAHRDLLLSQLHALRHGLEQYRLALTEGPYPGSEFCLMAVAPIRGDGARRRVAEERLDAVAHDHPETPWARTAELLKGTLGGCVLMRITFLPFPGVERGGKSR